LRVIVKVLGGNVGSLLAVAPALQPALGDLLLADRILLAGPDARGALRGDPHLLHDGIDAGNPALVVPEVQLYRVGDRSGVHDILPDLVHLFRVRIVIINRNGIQGR
jgi:hypothetical protein